MRRALCRHLFYWHIGGSSIISEEGGGNATADAARPPVITATLFFFIGVNSYSNDIKTESKLLYHATRQNTLARPSIDERKLVAMGPIISIFATSYLFDRR